MSKKNLLSEVRRFMKLANLDATISSNFVNKLDESDLAYNRDDESEETMQEEEEVEEEPIGMEDDLEADLDADLDADLGDELDTEMDMDMGMDMAAEEAVISDEEADIIIALGDRLAAARGEAAEEDAEEALDDLEVADDLEADAGDLEADAVAGFEDAADELMETEDETLEEILDGILGEENRTPEEIAADQAELDAVRQQAAKEKSEPHDRKSTRASTERHRAASKIGLRKEEALQQEVLRRVRARLKQMAKK